VSVTIKVEIPPDSRALIAKLQRFPVELGEAIKRGMNRAGALALGKITAERFTGLGPFPVSEHKLGVRTGRLRGSLRWTPAQSVTSGGQLIEVSGAMGSNVEYLGVHEFGFDGTVNVKSFTRKVPELRFGRAPAGPRARRPTTETVKAHTRTMRIPARAPLRTGIEEHLDDFTTEINSELQTLLESK
jgi:phage gpG-like protein